jgi:hypothetical protein
MKTHYHDGEQWLSTDHTQDHILFVAVAGHGKSLAINSLLNNILYYKPDVVVIDLLDTQKRMEGASKLFLPKKKWHLDGLTNFNIKPEQFQVELYHPIPKIGTHLPNTFPPFNFFTISLKDLSKECWNYLFNIKENESTAYADVFYNLVSNAKDDENLYNIMLKMYKRTAGNKSTSKITASSDSFYLPVDSASRNDMKHIIRNISSFSKIPLIAEAKFRSNIRLNDIIKHPGTFHIFSRSFYEHKKEYHLFIFWFLSSLREVAKSKLNRPIIIILDELIPISNDLLLRSLLLECLAFCRGKGISFIATCQSVSNLDAKLRNAFSEYIVGRISAPEIDAVSTMLRQSTISSKLLTLKRNEFIIGSMVGKGVYTFVLPPFAHFDPDEDFFIKYRQEFPEQMVRTTNTIRPLQEHFVNEINSHKKEVVNYLRLLQREQKEKEDGG